MNALARTIEACTASVEAHRERPFADRLPPRDVEAEAVKAWRAVDTLTTATPRDWRENIGALVEMQERIERMIEGAAK